MTGRWAWAFCRGLLAAALVVALAPPAAAQIAAEIMIEAMPVDFAELQANPRLFLDDTVILGGQIIEALPCPEGTRLTILQTKTKPNRRPKGPQTSRGRFIAICRDFLDPQIYAKGRQVTVGGKVAGQRTEKLGEMDYTYPLISAQQVYLWPKYEPRRYYYYPYHYRPYWPYYRYGPWGPWWW